MRDARVPKYEHRIRTVLSLRRDETAILCLLLLRGPQTPGELRGRSDRMHGFDDIAAVQAALERMAARTLEADPASGQAGTGPLAVQLPRQPGSRESRYAHRLGGAAAHTAEWVQAMSSAREEWGGDGLLARMEALEAEVAGLRARVEALEGR